MGTDVQMILLAVGAAAVGVLMLAPGSPLAQQANAVASGWQGTTWSPQRPRIAYYCRGGLLHPKVAGEGRTGLLRHGWGWISDPPSEQMGPGVSDG
jgi:hypothetical protein